MEKAFYRPIEVGEIIGLGRTKTYDLIRRGEIPSIRIGGNVRVPAALLREWIQEQIDIGRAIPTAAEGNSIKSQKTSRASVVGSK